jgi:hypothetical protein
MLAEYFGVAEAAAFSIHVREAVLYTAAPYIGVQAKTAVTTVTPIKNVFKMY